MKSAPAATILVYTGWNGPEDRVDPASDNIGGIDQTMKKLTGNCLCGAVSFEIVDDFHHFQLCHCTQCQKTTGTAHAANLFTDPANITWLTGTDDIVRYDVEGRRISNAFCRLCGSRVPFLSLSGNVLAVPAGSLNGTPSLSPGANIFWPERADWYDDALAATRYEGFAD